MDLMDFDGQELYFDQPLDGRAEALVAAAAEGYGAGSAEGPLLQAQVLAPESLTVLVALYRFYYYQHRLPEALAVAERALDLTARDLALPRDWRLLTELHVARAALVAMGLLRFHLLCLKALAYLLLRLGRQDEGRAMLRKLLELDTGNRLGARQLLEVVDPERRDEDAA